MDSRFVIFPGESSEIELSEEVPWSDLRLKQRRFELRVGWRCAVKIPPGARDAAVKFLHTLSKNKLPWDVGDQRFRASARMVTPDQNFGYPVLLIDLWTECRHGTPENLRRCLLAVEKLRNEIAAQLGLPSAFHSPWTLDTYQEFLEIRLPRRISRSLTRERATGIILARQQSGETGKGLPTLALDGSMLMLGPEHPGVIAAVRKFLEEYLSEPLARTDNRPHGYWIPILMALAMLSTWILPLAVWSLTLIVLVLTCLMCVACVPAFRTGWRSWFERASATASVGFFGIGLFGVGYAICALSSDYALGHVDKLGYPFLVSTGLGVAGGILGDNPKGAARILAHIQLFLFLGGLSGLVAMLLRIDRGVRRRE